MAYPYGTGSGVTFMKKTAKTDKHFFIKGAMVLFLVIYLGTLYNSDNAKYQDKEGEKEKNKSHPVKEKPGISL